MSLNGVAASLQVTSYMLQRWPWIWQWWAAAKSEEGKKKSAVYVLMEHLHRYSQRLEEDAMACQVVWRWLHEPMAKSATERSAGAKERHIALMRDRVAEAEAMATDDAKVDEVWARYAVEVRVGVDEFQAEQAARVGDNCNRQASKVRKVATDSTHAATVAATPTIVPTAHQQQRLRDYASGVPLKIREFAPMYAPGGDDADTSDVSDSFECERGLAQVKVEHDANVNASAATMREKIRAKSTTSEYGHTASGSPYGWGDLGPIAGSAGEGWLTKHHATYSRNCNVGDTKREYRAQQHAMKEATRDAVAQKMAEKRRKEREDIEKIRNSAGAYVHADPDNATTLCPLAMAAPDQDTLRQRAEALYRPVDDGTPVDELDVDAISHAVQADTDAARELKRLVTAALVDVDTTFEQWHQAWKEQANDDPLCGEVSHEEFMGSLTDADGNLPGPCDDCARGFPCRRRTLPSDEWLMEAHIGRRDTLADGTLAELAPGGFDLEKLKFSTHGWTVTLFCNHIGKRNLVAPWRSQVAFDAMVQVGVWGEGVRPPERTAMVRSWAELKRLGYRELLAMLRLLLRAEAIFCDAGVAERALHGPEDRGGDEDACSSDQEGTTQRMEVEELAEEAGLDSGLR